MMAYNAIKMIAYSKIYGLITAAVQRWICMMKLLNIQAQFTWYLISSCKLLPHFLDFSLIAKQDARGAYFTVLLEVEPSQN